ncbi:uncharacterized protein B0T15DRAFT_294294 [Chaetomium strumarium]|uniref:Uncharacterized protein n=1 Tax=Chaetomium strumarium TaxID=1170767 RepID=A0AAJ0GLH8_9PEZI|nr:hypothetical protein B0T15DRAFT_294294 [Chaetomium strumarium]
MRHRYTACGSQQRIGLNWCRRYRPRGSKRRWSLCALGCSSRRRRLNTLIKQDHHYYGRTAGVGRRGRGCLMRRESRRGRGAQLPLTSSGRTDEQNAKASQQADRSATRLPGSATQICYPDRKCGIIMGLLRHSHGLTMWSAARPCGCSVWRRQPGTLLRRLSQWQLCGDMIFAALRTGATLSKRSVAQFHCRPGTLRVPIRVVLRLIARTPEAGSYRRARGVLQV